METVSVGSYEVTDFNNEVLERSKSVPVLVDFWAAWCGPCRILGPVLEKLAREQAGRWVLAKVDTDRHQDVAASYGIRSIPNVKLFVDGEVADEFVGALPEQAVVRWLDHALPDPLKKDLDSARDLVTGGRTDEARTALDGILMKDAGNETALVLLSRLELFTDPGRAADLISGIEPGSEQHATAEALHIIARLLLKGKSESQLPEDPVRPEYRTAIRKLADQDFDGALEGFINVIRASRHYDDDGARKACIAIFRYLGDDSAVTQRHRRAFSSSLNI